MKELLFHPATLALVAQALVVLTLAIRVIMKRPATGVALAWILLIAMAPPVGAVIYLLIGERRIGYRRARGIDRLRVDYRQIAHAAIRSGLLDIDWNCHSPHVQGMDRIGRRLVGFPTVHGSTHQLMSDTEEILRAIACDIEAAKKSVFIEFYIWQDGGLADDVLEAVIRAAQRGVFCCLLIDAVGARPWWWWSKQPRRLRAAGVRLQRALPVGIFRSFVGRTDLRLHRKIVVVDGKVAWTGSMNMVDPRFFKQEAGVGQWVDAMARLEGSVVVPLAATMIGDWMLESSQPLSELVDAAKLQLVEPQGEADIQVIPSGPGESGDAQLQMVLALINSAHDEVVLTTPYLVPDESLLRAMRGVAARGVKTRLIVPEKVDSFLTRYASRSYFDDLLNAGIEIHLYRKGLLHTKSITVDSERAMFGTVNFDLRSFWLNYEVALYIYHSSFAKEIRELQASYIAQSERIESDRWGHRSLACRFLENSCRLASPLL
ncbi:MAG: cardiolipin synthase [Planctomycetales bacterium]|nr:cardiolipin synthase [Planctomycetales bacterium]